MQIKVFRLEDLSPKHPEFLASGSIRTFPNGLFECEIVVHSFQCLSFTLTQGHSPGDGEIGLKEI